MWQRITSQKKTVCFVKWHGKKLKDRKGKAEMHNRAIASFSIYYIEIY